MKCIQIQCLDLISNLTIKNINKVLETYEKHIKTFIVIGN